MEFYRYDRDQVIEGYVIAGATTYEYALEHFVPLIGRLDIQRDALKTKFYSRLEADIVRGCVMPPITIALIGEIKARRNVADAVYKFITNNIQDGFVLDGIQRLNTLERASLWEAFDADRTLHVNFVIAKSRDRLLYRMITLNNGQKPMSARHQIDVLADAFFDFNHLPLSLVSEKSKGRVRAPDTFKKADFVKGYVAYLSNSVSVDNQKIIEEKMDELIASRIIDSDISSRETEFSDVVELIDKFSAREFLRDWIRSQNNFIGFCVGIKRSLKILRKVPLKDVEEVIRSFEHAFNSINVSKVNLGKVRRETVAKFIEQFDDMKDLDEYDLLDKISDWI